MPLELHIWGPGFGLPSIDAECLAAIAYLRHCRPDGAWVLVPSSRPDISPYGELPALKHKGLWVARYQNIVGYLRSISDGHWDLDKHLDPLQRADSTAFTSFLACHGQPLLDLYFYVSSENYTSRTRGELHKILAWPESWTIPGKLREKAKKRSEHLGLSSLDIDIAKEKEDAGDSSLTAQIPESLRKPKQTVSQLLGKHASKDRFKLDAISASFFEPLEELLGHTGNLLDGKVTSLDCLALGYLALMMRPEMPQDWLRTALVKKYNELGRWLDMNAQKSFGMRRNMRGETFTIPHPDGPGDVAFDLPWQSPTSGSWSDKYRMLVNSFVYSLPALGRRSAEVEKAAPSEHLDAYASKQKVLVSMRRDQFWYSQVVISTLGLGILTSYLLWTGLLELPIRKATTRPHTFGARRFGEAGSLLGLR